MNEKDKSFLTAFFIGLLLFILGAVIGYCACNYVRSAEVAELTARYDDAKRERDETIDRITEDNQRLRDGAARAQIELDAATERTNRLEEYFRSAGIGNKQVTADLNGAGQNLAEASRIIEHYLEEQ